MLEDINDRIEKAKSKPLLALERFHIGDIVYPFFSHNLVNWGTVVDIIPSTRKIIVNFNGINRQFDPEWLIHTNPDLKKASKNRIAYQFDRMVESVYYKEAPSMFKLSESEKESGEAICPTCGKLLQIYFNPQTKKADLICENCGRKISGEKIIEASKIGDLMISIEEFVDYIKKEGVSLKKEDVLKLFVDKNPIYRDVCKEFPKEMLSDILEQLKIKNIKLS